MPVPRWREEPPTDVELTDPRIVGWMFRGDLLPRNVSMISHAIVEGGISPPLLETRMTTSHIGAVLSVGIINGVPYANWCGHVVRVDGMRGQWCPIFAPEEP